MSLVKTAFRILAVLYVLSVVQSYCPAHSQAAPYTPTRFTVTTEGPSSGPAILLIPGLTSGREVFSTEAATLAPTYRLYRVQLNGFAGQPAGPNASGPILAPVVEELHHYLVANHLHPYVIGHSLGGLLGLMLAKAHPEDVQKLLIVDSLPFYGLVFSPNATVDKVRPQGEMMREQIANQSPDQRAAGAAQTAAMLVKTPEGTKVVAANSIASDPHVFANAMFEDLTADLRPELASIKTPTTVLYPYDSTLEGPDPARFDALYRGAYSTMPNVTFQRIDDSRHFIQFDQPAAFNSAVQAFLK